MALNVADRRRFRNWQLKTMAGPLLACLCFAIDWGIKDPQDLLHILTLGILLFAGFPLGNLIFEKKRGMLALYHGTHFLLFMAPLFWLPTVAGPAWGASIWPALTDFSSKMPVIPPYDMLACLLAFVWAEAGLMLLMPKTSQRIENYREWRRIKVQEIRDAHY